VLKTSIPLKLMHSPSSGCQMDLNLVVSKLPTARDPNGSSHGQEVAYVFGNLGGPGRPAPTDADVAISHEMQDYWVNFATNGDPNGPGLPVWPAFTEASPLVMGFGTDTGPALIPHLDRLKVLGAYNAWRRAGSN
jgi:para-nitrobenzyl esterase